MRKFIHFTQPLFGKEERKEVLDAMASGWVTLGPKTKQFEEDFAKYVDAKFAIGVTSCTAGLHLSLVAAGIGSGDEVITTPFTFVASVNVIEHVGAKPVFVDVEKDSFLMDADQIEKVITKKTKAIIPVHYGGQAVDMRKIMKIAKKHNLVVIEDAAHATGAMFNGQKIGTHGDFVNFSFHPVKNMSTGDGGMITTNNQKYAEILSQLRLHGMSKDAWKRHSASGSWKYDIVSPGYKYNMTDIQSALGIQQLKKLPSFIKTRQKYAKIYDDLFINTPEISIPAVLRKGEHIYSLYTVKINSANLSIDRDEIIELLKEAQIGPSVYFIPVHHFTYYKDKYKFNPKKFPVTEEIFTQIISLPLYPGMKEADIRYVANQLVSIISSHRK